MKKVSCKQIHLEHASPQSLRKFQLETNNHRLPRDNCILLPNREFFLYIDKDWIKNSNREKLR